MKKPLLYLIPVVLFTLASCGGNPQDKDYLMNNTLGDDEQEVPLGHPSNVTDFTKDDTDYTHRTGDVKTTDMIRIFYRKVDFTANYASYVGWRVWAWDSGNGGNGNWYEFTKYNDYGVICDIPVTEVAANKTSITTMGIVLTNCNSPTTSWGDATNSYSKDPDSDLIATINPNNIDGVQTIYCKGKTKQVFYDQNSAFMSSLDYSYYKDEHTLRAVFMTNKTDFLPHKGRFTVLMDGQEINDFRLANVTSTGKGVDLIFDQNLSPFSKYELKYRVSASSQTSKNAVLSGAFYDSENFKNNYLYQDNDLGVSFDNDDSPNKTTFKLWAPVCSKVTLKLYDSSDYSKDKTPKQTYAMEKGEKGVFTKTVDSNLEGMYYTFEVTNYVGTNEVCDPYAKACGINGKRGLVVNFKKLNQEITGWANDIHPNFGEHATDAIISEIHVRDMTINPNSGVSSTNRGRFLGLTEKGTTYTENNITVSTGLDHLKELGITHVQIQPMYDYASVDEATLDNTYGEDNYNWGYDPLNYNCLEGSYSTDPYNGYTRIKEAKAMIMTLHNEGISINMDVVYNHTSGFINSNFQLIVPNYYYRTDLAGVPSNGSGCGNEIASERYMVNKFIRESCKFWVDEYHIDGFRFDLMGLLDNQTMIDVYNDCHSLYNKIMVYGEPWTGGGTTLGGGTDPNKLNAQQTVQKSLAQSYFAGNNVLVGAFNDIIRNAVRGDNNPGKGFVNGAYASTGNAVVPGIKGVFSNADSSISPCQVINYVSCHDNFTLNDQLKQTKIGDIERAYSQADAIVLLAEGVPFIQEGEEFLRTKLKADNTYDHNSYMSGDIVNSMDYSLKVKNIDMFNFMKDLIAFRKANKIFRLSSREEINSKLLNIKYSNDSSITYSLIDGEKEYKIYHFANTGVISNMEEATLIFTNGNKTVGEKYSGTFTVSSNETLVFVK